VLDLQSQTREVRPGEELDLARLGEFLGARLPGKNGAVSVRQFPSGHSNLTYLVTFGAREMVLRRPPFGSKVKTAHDMGREFRVLSKLHGAFVAAPKVILYCDDDSVIGAPFYLMEPIAGVIPRRAMPKGYELTPERAKGLSESFIDTLARLHRLDYAAIGLADLGKPQGYMERQVRGWSERYHAAKTHEFVGSERMLAWFAENAPASGEAALIHNDYKYDNVILDPADITRIVGVLDWEMCTIGDPLSDLGTTLAYWVDADDPEELKVLRWSPTDAPGSLTRQELAERYALRTGRDVLHLRFYLAFAYFKIAVIVQQIYFRYHQGLTKDERFASMPAVVETLLRAAARTIG
jgi:aminoglycoside phosphotransferase (APT) family kinase protein